jgi:hypothetical protein
LIVPDKKSKSSFKISIFHPKTIIIRTLMTSGNNMIV